MATKPQSKPGALERQVDKALGAAGLSLDVRPEDLLERLKTRSTPAPPGRGRGARKAARTTKKKTAKAKKKAAKPTPKKKAAKPTPKKKTTKRAPSPKKAKTARPPKSQAKANPSLRKTKRKAAKK